jgi:type I restriction enzyme S subunit
LLATLDQVVAKKRDLKQAAMQQLLTGKTRLPGFCGEWQKKTLGELGATYGGITGKTKSDFGVGTAKYITFMNVMTNAVIDCAAFEQVNISASETQNRVLRGDLLFNGSSETPEEVAFCSLMAEEVPDLYLNSFCFGFRLFDDQQVNGLFLTYYIRANPGREMMKSLAQGSTRYNLSKTALRGASVLLPLKDEQVAIAEVLSGLDAELIALEARRDKSRNIKQAMMQQLLTGKTRPIAKEECHV